MNTNTPFTQPEVNEPQHTGSATTPTKATGFVRAEGRTRKAGYWICGAGIAVILSSFLPWVSIEGVEATHQSGGAVVMLLVIGGLLAYFGAPSSRVALPGRSTSRCGSSPASTSP